jgi:transcriptional regulator with XRE-family HTH domain
MIIRKTVQCTYHHEILRSEIRRQKLSIQALASERGVTHVHLSRILHGKGKFNSGHVEWLCEKLQVDPSKILVAS